jgi:hypothetical protein
MKFLFILLFSFFGLAAQAQMEFGLAGGPRYSQADTNISGASVASKLGLQAGVLGYLPFAKTWGLRTGFFYTQRYVTIQKTASGDVDIQYSYFDVPATLRLQVSDRAGIFGGPILAFNQSKDVSCSKNSSCSALDVKSVILPWQIGLNFRMLSQFGGELYFEYAPGDLSTNVSDMRTVGVNAVLYFE